MHTSVHGVGHAFVQSAFKAFDLHLPYAVEEQKDPDPEFPTVKYPNPEEGEGVLVRYKHSHAVKKYTWCVWFNSVYVCVSFADIVICIGREGGGHCCAGE